MKPKVTLRDLFWLVLVAAVGLGWWVHATQLRQESRGVRNTLLETEIRLDKAEDDNEEWSDQYNALLDAVEAKGFVALWNHHFRTASLELEDDWRAREALRRELP